MQQTRCTNGLIRSRNRVYTERPMTTIQESTFVLHFTATYLPRNDGSQQPVIVVDSILTQPGASLKEAHDKYAEARGTKDMEYLICNVTGPSHLSFNLDITVAEAGFSITNPWVTTRPFYLSNDGPVFLPEHSEEDPNNADRDYPITLNVFATT